MSVFLTQFARLNDVYSFLWVYGTRGTFGVFSICFFVDFLVFQCSTLRSIIFGSAIFHHRIGWHLGGMRESAYALRIDICTTSDAIRDLWRTTWSRFFSVRRYLFASVLSKSQSRSEISFSCMCFWLAFERCAFGSLCIGASFNIVAQTCKCICSALCSARHPSKPK